MGEKIYIGCHADILALKLFGSGHLERMEENRMPKMIFSQELEGTRRRWKEEVERDLHVLGVRRWRELATDRKKWRDIFRQAKAHSGL
jgi:hypothetical protein